ncbi:hypothetical protein KJ819_03620 [Patescibacteria group bacterium]|nr:hypothetical protein [Patescibacteria group bacterium]MBU1500452.1 hypothetical protein [Patescibacteria group bacterium]MBU2080750.1 hypothetical protein [Patescibacteria group bacterium]MBU2123855.1 hypothetical protein [Patescibacteria group bacterium]MBU2194854.1 hypothetical protein [Patescibacteria group bacterium]
MLRFWESGEIKDLREIVVFLHRYLSNLSQLERKTTPELFAVTRFLVEENIDIYESIITLRKKGRFLPCLTLARSLLENSINLQYIYQKDTEQRARNFYHYPLREYVMRTESLPNISELQAKLLRKMQEELKSHKPAGKRRHHWDGKSISEIFSELDLKDTHAPLYSRLSGFTHAQFGNRDFLQDRPYINFLKTVATKEVFVSVLESLRVVTEHFDLEPDVVRIEDFPKEGSTLLFSTHPKKSEKEMEVMWKRP